MQEANTIKGTHRLLYPHIACYTSTNSRPIQDDSCNCGMYSLLDTRVTFLADLHHHVKWNKVHNVHLLWSLVLRPFCEKKCKHVRARLEECITKFCSNYYILLRDQSGGPTLWNQSRGDLSSSSTSSLASALSNNLAAVDTNTEAIEIKHQTNDEVDDNTMCWQYVPYN
jgi:hypothetical protein